ncbi:hypothetical protein BC937DRAFT_90209 [Endogone sp. FLAS-F59071]|nr:hypothetical protein BC937DRAFT_90209 [Endogone sp. FLAS-F59071]|eukprot:RUS17256.1 hypothetical protein BC937DRAFT_90209 [Endogone sp. FLAS-F59071]
MDLMMDRATEAAAHDLAEVRKLIEGMNTLVHTHQATLSANNNPVAPQPQSQTDATQEGLVTGDAAAAQAKLNNTVNNGDRTTAIGGEAGSAVATPATGTAPGVTIIVEVNHLALGRTLYFSLAPDATIEPLVTWLRISFDDSSISGMVLQYKGFDGLWKCLLNRDDSLKRILKQSHKGNNIVQLRVPREADLLSSGYTDKRLLALTTKTAV